MRYKIFLTKKFDRKFSKLDEQLQLRVIKKLRTLESEPRTGKNLKGKFKNLFSVRVGNYRVFYTIDEKRKVIFIITIKHRKSAYK